MALATHEPESDEMGLVRVLVVDDHPSVRSGVTAVLDGAAGFEAAGSTADWREALELAHVGKVDVVLLDWSVVTNDENGEGRNGSPNGTSASKS